MVERANGFFEVCQNLRIRFYGWARKGLWSNSDISRSSNLSCPFEPLYREFLIAAGQ